MEVVSYQLGAHVEEPAIMLDSFPERAQRLVVLHVPDVVAHEGVAVSDQAERVLELSTAGQGVPAEVRGQPERCRGVATGATDRVRPSSRSTDHGVVAAHVDLTVVDEEVVGDLAQLIQRFLVAIGDGLVRVVAAGHDERDARVAQKQVVQRRVSEHHAQGFLARGYLFGDTGTLPTFQEYYGACRRGEQRLFVRGDEADLTYLSEAACHEREGLVLAHLAAPQGPYSLLVEWVAGQMVTAETLCGDDSPATQHPRGACNGVIRAGVKLVPEPVEQPYLRSAYGAGVGLGVEAAVGGILVLAAAVGAHSKARHRSRGPVVRNRAGDGEARAAVRAIGERVTVTPVRGIQKLDQAIFARSDVRRDERLTTQPIPALLDAELAVPERRERLPEDGLDHGQGRGVFFQRAHEASELLRRALDFDADALSIVADRPREPVPACQGVDEGPKADPLHDATHTDLTSLAGRGFHGARHRWRAVVFIKSICSTIQCVPYPRGATYCASSCNGGCSATVRRRRPRRSVTLRGTTASSRLDLPFYGGPGGLSGSFVGTHLRNERLNQLRGFLHREAYRFAKFHKHVVVGVGLRPTPTAWDHLRLA